MTLVATLISHPDRPAVSTSLANKACKAIGASAIAWLAEEIACEMTVDMEPLAADRLLRQAVGDAPVDVAVQAPESRRKRLLIADMDSTMIDQECIDELAEEAGLKAHVAEITTRAMNGEIAFEPALRERVALLKGLPLSVINKVITERITLASGGRTLVTTMKANGAHTALVSGGFTAFTGPIGAKLGFDETQANRLIDEGGRLNGQVAEPILGREAKAQALRTITARLGIGLEDAIAVGDGANDLDMIDLAGAGVALHAKPSVAERARFRIDHGDLTALLYLQGYRRDEFVT
ncbi:phosphoserine phosphatase SerB [Mesorhizobium xinjiangense]|uniref:phosphoserine phosphatase SerB n=1 Tax=Mesorhizobium xinjiangense TaxID=2678685 RepID=UPI0012EE37B9|nr:phosphoserine phosphatase SerB [Mesorhizobium xinjiangense]